MLINILIVSLKMFILKIKECLICCLRIIRWLLKAKWNVYLKNMSKIWFWFCRFLLYKVGTCLKRIKKLRCVQKTLFKKEDWQKELKCDIINKSPEGDRTSGEVKEFEITFKSNWKNSKNFLKKALDKLKKMWYNK